MRLIVAMLKVIGPFEISKEIIDDPNAFAGMVVYVEPSHSGTEETVRFSLKNHSELAGTVDNAGSVTVQ